MDDIIKPKRFCGVTEDQLETGAAASGSHVGLIGEWKVVEVEPEVQSEEPGKEVEPDPHANTDDEGKEAEFSADDELICQTEQEKEAIMLKQMRKLAEHDCLDEELRKDTFVPPDDKEDRPEASQTKVAGFKKRVMKAKSKKKASLLNDGEQE
jgi:hypothetical protein